MKKDEFMKYRDSFNDIDEWKTITEELDEKTIRSIKRSMLKYDAYKDFDFNPDHLKAIEKLRVTRKTSSVWKGGTEKTIDAEFDRISSTVELTIKENGKEINKSKVSVSEAIIESFFREEIEHRISRYQMEKEYGLPMSPMLDAPTYGGAVTWYKNDQVVFLTRGEYEPVNVDCYIEMAKKTIIISIEHDADYHEHND